MSDHNVSLVRNLAEAKYHTIVETNGFYPGWDARGHGSKTAKVSTFVKVL